MTRFIGNLKAIGSKMPINGLTKVVYPLWVRVILAIVTGWLFIYDLLAYIPFVVFANPTRKLKNSARLKVSAIFNFLGRGREIDFGGGGGGVGLLGLAGPSWLYVKNCFSG